VKVEGSLEIRKTGRSTSDWPVAQVLVRGRRRRRLRDQVAQAGERPASLLS
jgi:hypothetical protein